MSDCSMLQALVFLGFGDGSGVFLTKPRYEFTAKFFARRESAGTWAEFIGAFGPDEQRYLAMFQECDDVQPLASDSLDSLRNDVFVLNDPEFPLPQLADETYEDILKLPAWHVPEARILVTEFGTSIGVFLETEIPQIESRSGVRIEIATAPFRWEIRSYGG